MSELPPLPYEGIPLTPIRPKPRGRMANAEQIEEIILDRMIAGESLRAICASEGMPAAKTVLRWVIDSEDFRDRYARAMEARAYGMADEILTISDDGSNDTYADEQGNERTDTDVIQRSKLRVDTRKWLMARMAPKRYGDKITQEHTGKDGAALIPIITVNGTSTGG